MLCMEDGVMTELGGADNYGGGPSKAIDDYYAAHPGVFEVDEYYCDMFGPKATYAQNGYKRKT